MDVVLHLDMVTQKIDIQGISILLNTFFKLEKLFRCNDKNISIGGASNCRIVRTTIEGVKEYTPIAVIVQWTSDIEVNGR